METFFKRKLVVEFDLNEDKRESSQDFINDGHKIQRFTDLAIHANISRCEGQHQMDLEVHGLARELMNVLTTIREAAMLNLNHSSFKIITVRLYSTIPAVKGVAGIYSESLDGDNNSEQALKLLFEGMVDRAVADFNNAPDVTLSLHVNSKMENQTIEVVPKTFKGNWKAVDVLDYIFQQQERGFPIYIGKDIRNISLSSDHVAKGSFQDAINSVCSSTGIKCIPKDKNYIFYTGDDPKLDKVAYPINESTGLIGYPVMMDDGVELRLLYGQELDLYDYILLTTTEQDFLNGYYRVTASSLSVSSEIPQSEWTQVVRCVYSSYETSSAQKSGDDGKATAGQQIVPPIIKQ